MINNTMSIECVYQSTSWPECHCRLRDRSLFMTSGTGGKSDGRAYKFFWWTGSGLGKKLRRPEWASIYFLLENFHRWRGIFPYKLHSNKYNWQISFLWKFIFVLFKSGRRKITLTWKKIPFRVFKRVPPIIKGRPLRQMFRTSRTFRQQGKILYNTLI